MSLAGKPDSLSSVLKATIRLPSESNNHVVPNITLDAVLASSSCGSIVSGDHLRIWTFERKDRADLGTVILLMTLLPVQTSARLMMWISR